jgi:hypothetical protein
MLSIRVPGGTEYPLPLLDAETTDLLTEWYDNGKFDELVSPAVSCYTPADPPYRVGSLYWPVVGACRFARAVLPIDTYTLGQLRGDVANPPLLDEDGEVILDEDGLPITSAGSASPRVILSYTDQEDEEEPLRDEDGDVILDEDGAEVLGTEEPREFPMYVIASRPVSRTTEDVDFPADDPADTPGTEDDLWLVTLVDRRWYWAHVNGYGKITEEDDYVPQTWTALFAAVLDAQVDADDYPQTLDVPHADYGEPSDRYARARVNRMPSAYLLDHAADRAGMRVVVLPESVHVQAPSAANRAVATAFAQRYGWTRGGGGTIENDEIYAGVPLSVYNPETDEEVENPTGVTGAGVAARLDSADALQRWASDWYAWQNAPLDAVYDGFVPVPESGFVGSVELFHDSLTGYTRVSRAPVNWVPVLDCYGAEESGDAASGDCEPGCGWVAKLQTTDCLKLTTVCGLASEQTLILTWDNVNSWDNASGLSLPSGSGAVSAFITGGELHLSVNGSELIRAGCDSGVAYFTGGPATGHGVAADDCAGATFTVKVECHPCSETSSCCETMPPVVYMCLQTGTCDADHDGQYVMEFASIDVGDLQGPAYWAPTGDRYDGTFTQCNTLPVWWLLYCFEGTWYLAQVAASNPAHVCAGVLGGIAAEAGWTCDPFDMTFSIPGPVRGCTTATTWRITGSPCTPGETTTYDCISGSCVEVAGDSGAYQTQAECEADCDSSSTGCCEDEPNTVLLTITATGAVGCDPPFNAPAASLGMVRTGTGQWNSAFGDSFEACATCTAQLTCSGGAWDLSLGNCDGFFTLALAGAECDPFVVSFQGTYSCGTCSCNITATCTGL